VSVRELTGWTLCRDWTGEADVIANWAEDKRWEPKADQGERERLYRNWKKAVTKTFDWVDADVPGDVPRACRGVGRPIPPQTRLPRRGPVLVPCQVGDLVEDAGGVVVDAGLGGDQLAGEGDRDRL